MFNMAKWTCPCNKLWYLCAEHAPIGHLSGSAPRSKPEQRPKGGEKRQLNTQHVDQLDEPCRKRQQADGHDHSHRRVRKRNLANSQEKNTKKHKKGTDQDAIDAINRLRAARLHLSSSGPGARLLAFFALMGLHPTPPCPTRDTNPSTNQPTNQPLDSFNNPSTNQPTNQPTTRPTTHSFALFFRGT